MSEPSGLRQPAVPPAKSTTSAKIIMTIVLLLLFGGLGAAVYFMRQADRGLAKVGDCVAQESGNSVSVVECTDPDADFTVVGRLVNKTQVDAGLFACSGFEKATSSYWEGKQGKKGTVLCLAKK